MDSGQKTQECQIKVALLNKATEAKRQIKTNSRDLKTNDLPRANWIVQKFGGTSIGKCAVNIVEDIVLTGLRKNQIAVVCSARSIIAKSGGTTSRLLQAAEDVLTAESRKYVNIVAELHTEHVVVGQETIDDEHILKQYIADVGWECYNLLRILESARNLRAMTNQTKDMVIGVGEKLSCLLMAALMRTKGINAICIDLGEIIDHNSPITALDDEFYKNIARIMRTKVFALGPKVVPVITGYFGKVPGGLLEQIGRGYTDLCAAIAAVALQAVELQIWKEVDGVFTADPRKVSNARLLKSVTPAEAAELSFYGSEVIHPFTMDQVIFARIPIRIQSVMNPRSGGTVIYADSTNTISATTLPEVLQNRPSSFTLEALPKQPTAVTAKSHITVLNVRSNKKTRAHGFLASIFSILDQNWLSVDLVSSSEVHISMAIHSGNALLTTLQGGGGSQAHAEALQRATTSLKAWGDVSIVPDQTIISLIGCQLRGMKGISGHFLSILGENDINIEMISQGASEISVSCVIKEEDAIRALNAIHTKLFSF